MRGAPEPSLRCRSPSSPHATHNPAGITTLQESPFFAEFLDMLGSRVTLQGFDDYAGGLDTRKGSTGTHSLFA